MESRSTLAELKQNVAQLLQRPEPKLQGSQGAHAQPNDVFDAFLPLHERFALSSAKTVLGV